MVKRSVVKSPSARLCAVVKHRAKARGIPFDLTKEDIIIPEFCPILGMPIAVGAGTQSKAGTSLPSFASVDRLDSSKGYTKDNIQVISFLANSMKRNATPEQLLAFADWVYATYKGEGK